MKGRTFRSMKHSFVGCAGSEPKEINDRNSTTKVVPFHLSRRPFAPLYLLQLSQRASRLRRYEVDHPLLFLTVRRSILFS